MAENYVRPPLLGREAPSRRLAVWRFRALALLVAAALVVVVIAIYQRLSGATAEDPRLSSLPAAVGISLSR